MKKRFFSAFAVFFAAAVFVFSLGSCSDSFGKNGTGEISFTIGADAIEKAFASVSSRSALASEDSDYNEQEPGMELQVALSGDYYASKSVSVSHADIEEKKSIEFSFSGVPLGSNVRAIALVSMKSSYDGKTSYYLEYAGISDSVEVSDGNNNCSIKIASVWSLTESKNGDADVFYGSADDERYTLTAAKTYSKEAGVFVIKKGYETYSIGEWKMLDSSDTKNDVTNIAATEYVYCNSDGSFSVAKSPKAVELNNCNNGFSFTSNSGKTIKFGENAYSSYKLDIYYGETNSSYAKIASLSGDWTLGDDKDMIEAYKTAIITAFNDIGLVESGSYSYANPDANTGLITFSIYVYGTPSADIANAYFPTNEGYDKSNVSSWYAANETEGSKYFTFSLFMFEDGTFIATRHKYDSSENTTNPISKKIEQKGTCTKTEYSDGSISYTSGIATAAEIVEDDVTADVEYKYAATDKFFIIEPRLYDGGEMFSMVYVKQDNSALSNVAEE